MNYAQYLQQGGQTPSIEEQVASLVQAAIQGDQQANDQINQIMQAAEQGDQKAQQLAQLIQQVAQKLQDERPEAMKCGGKVRSKMKKACGGKVKAKVKKASCGKKMEKGGETPIKKEAKGGKPCPCTLHKVGGKLIEVDCNGIPVAKNGTKIVYSQTPATNTAGWLLVPQTQTNILDPHKYEDPLLNHQYEYQRYSKQKQAEEKRKQEMADSEAWRNSFNAGGINYNGKLPNFYTTNAMKKEPLPNIWIQNAENYNKQAKEYATQKLNEQYPKLIQKKEQPQTTWRDTFGAGKSGKFGGLTYDEAIARQKEMAAAQGFNANFGKQDGMWGQKSKAEWERYQAWKQQQADLAQRKADRETAGLLLSRPAVQAQSVQQDAIHPTDDRLREMDVKRAMGLPFNQDYRRWLELKFSGVKQPPLLQGNTDWLTMYRETAMRPMFKNGGSVNYSQYLNLK